MIPASVSDMPNAPKKRPRKRKITPILTSTVPDRERGPDEPHMVGYVRVSMNDQSNQRQVDELVMAGVGAVDIFSDVGTGANMDRQGWEDCARDLRAGDILVIHSLDRLSRDLVHTMMTLRELNNRGVTVRVLTMDFDSRTPMGRFVFAQMAAFSQFERDVINERTAHGLAKARERGVFGGSKIKWTDEQIAAAVKDHGTYEAAAKALGCSVVTVKRRMPGIAAQAKKQKRKEAQDE
jgi:DNA invertase Pin-like site-specific DNA recombinase